MNLSENIEKLIRQLNVLKVNPTKHLDERILGDALKLQKELKTRLSAPQSNIRSIILRNPITKLAAAAVIILVAILMFSRLWGSNIAFAEVLQKIQGKSYTFDLSLIDEGSSSQNKVSVFEPGIVRIDSEGPAQVSSIFHARNGKSLLLFHQQRVGIILKPGSSSLSLTSEAGLMSLFVKPIQNLWDLKDGTEKEIGEKEINGRRAKGFKVFQEDGFCKYEIAVWADSKTSDPILVEIVMRSLDKPKESMTFVMDNFELGVKLDKRLFGLELPDGYTLAYQKELSQIDKGTKTSDEAQKIEKMMMLWSEKKRDEAVKILLAINWEKSFEFTKSAYIFSMTEKEFVSLKPEAQQQVMSEILDTGTKVREISREVISLGQQAMINKDYDKSEKRFSTVFEFGKLITRDADLMLVSRMIGLAVKRIALDEMIKLYTATSNEKKTSETQNELREVEADYEQIKQKARGQ